MYFGNHYNKFCGRKIEIERMETLDKHYFHTATFLVCIFDRDSCKNNIAMLDAERSVVFGAS